MNRTQLRKVIEKIADEQFDIYAEEANKLSEFLAIEEKQHEELKKLKNEIADIKEGCIALERNITLGWQISWFGRLWHVLNNSGVPISRGHKSIFEMLKDNNE